MIVVAGIPSEVPIAMVRKELEAMNSKYLMFNQREFENTSLDFCIENKRITGTLRIREDKCDLSSIEGMYMRLMDENLLPEIENEQPGSVKRYKCKNLHESFFLLSEIAPWKVVNRMSAMGSNSSKPYQAEIIKKYGFNVPETLITNNESAAIEFRNRFKKVVYKSVSGVRSIVQILGEEDMQRLKLISMCPVQFQEYIDGLNVRVHVVGDDVFATSIETDYPDYRYASRFGSDAKLAEYKLDDVTSKNCVKLAEGLNLDVAGIDLKVTPDDEVYCFEVNPSPAFSYYQSNTGQPIARSIAEYLLNKD